MPLFALFRETELRTGQWLCWRVVAKIVVRRCFCLGTVCVVSCLSLAALRITTALRTCAATRLHPSE